MLVLPLTCFEIVKIGEEEIISNKNANNIRYRKIYLNYLDKYDEQIKRSVEEKKFNEEEITQFFENSMDSKFGVSMQNCYKLKNKLNIQYCMSIGASPYNSFFINQIANSFCSQLLNMVGKSSFLNAGNLDNELPEILSECKKKGLFNFLNFIKPKPLINVNDKIHILTDPFKLINMFINNVDKQFQRQFQNYYNFDAHYSIGFCLGNFLANFESFIEAPNATKLISMISLSFAIGPQFIKMYPDILTKVGIKIRHLPKVGLFFDGLNILYASIIELISIYHFSLTHQANITGKFAMKEFLKLGTGVLTSFLGALATKGVLIFFGIATFPGAVVIVEVFGGMVFGIAGKKIAGLILDSEKTFGKDEFKLTSNNLYYKYFPKKYRIKGNNPHLHWNKTYLCSNVESYIIECIVNEVELIMRVMNIPKDVYDLPECLGYKSVKSKKNYLVNPNDNDSICDTDADENKIDEDEAIKITSNNKYIGDLILPYQGIKENAYRIDFIIYRIKKKRIKVDDWENSKEKDKMIEIGFVLSVY